MFKAIGPNIWTRDGPELVFAGARMHTRMTVIQLSNGDLWVHSPIEFSAQVRSEIQELGGNVCALVAPNKFHYMYIAQWREFFPAAHIFAEPNLMSKIPALAAATELTNTAPILYGTDIDQQIFGGNRLFQEAIFFHKSSRTLILTDLMLNLKLDNVGFLPGLFLRFEQAVFPNGGVPRLFRWLTNDKVTARKTLNVIKAWDPKVVTFCHGEPLAGEASELISQQFSWLG